MSLRRAEHPPSSSPQRLPASVSIYHQGIAASPGKHHLEHPRTMQGGRWLLSREPSSPLTPRCSSVAQQGGKDARRDLLRLSAAQGMR